MCLPVISQPKHKPSPTNQNQTQPNQNQNQNQLKPNPTRPDPTQPQEPTPFEIGIVAGIATADILRPPPEWEAYIAPYRWRGGGGEGV